MVGCVARRLAARLATSHPRFRSYCKTREKYNINDNNVSLFFGVVVAWCLCSWFVRGPAYTIPAQCEGSDLAMTVGSIVSCFV